MTVLVDTSVWIAHLRKGEPFLGELLNRGLVLMHPFIVGELACGNLRNRLDVLRDLESLPRVISATHSEVMTLIEDRRLSGCGIGWIDANLLASSILSNCAFWTLDAKLLRVARQIGVTSPISGHFPLPETFVLLPTQSNAHILSDAR